ncbi:MAG: thiamine phosphate synthase, partial [Verrucomicrobiae bacterium]|nr:thiamine phosphate synthase [Verrucomicrobiae bacterium]
MSHFLLQCITLDGIDIPHEDQVMQLCEAGAKWIQLRMKNSSKTEVKQVAQSVKPFCDDHGAILLINDYLDIALQTGVGGVHLGRMDMDWKEARKVAGPDLIIGGTVNSLRDARFALASDCLDYVGVGPFRFTSTKERLAPVLEKRQLEEIVEFLGDLPKVVIGGVQPDDL